VSVASVIDRQETGTYTVTRYAARTYTKGRLDSASTSTVTIDAVIQPLSGRDLQLLPEGSSALESIAIWTRTALRVSAASQQADRISYGNETYEIQNVTVWATPGGYYKAIASRIL
jgi:hypothetical protein